MFLIQIGFTDTPFSLRLERSSPQSSEENKQKPANNLPKAGISKWHYNKGIQYGFSKIYPNNKGYIFSEIFLSIMYFPKKQYAGVSRQNFFFETMVLSGVVK